MPSSMSPARRKRSRPKVPSRTIETLLMPVPVSVGSAGTAPRSGHRTSKPDVVQRERVAGREPAGAAPLGSELGDPGPVAGSGSAHPRLDDPRDPVSLEQQGHAGDVILVGMGQHEQVDAAVPGRHVRVEGDKEAIRIGSAIDEHPRAPVGVDEDRVALPDIEHRDPDPPVRAVQGDGADADDDDGQRRPRSALRARRVAPRAAAARGVAARGRRRRGAG